MRKTATPDPRGRGEKGWTLLEVLAAVVVVGIGILMFTRVQHASSRDSNTNSRILMAGKSIEKFLEDTRIAIAKDTLRNWPPATRTIAGTAPNYIKIASTVTPAFSPKDGAPVANVVRMDIMASWTQPYKDSLKVTTYVSKRF
jgi:prepilin-type N-terminal cleavage/methylation domain-containing protein